MLRQKKDPGGKPRLAPPGSTCQRAQWEEGCALQQDRSMIVSPPLARYSAIAIFYRDSATHANRPGYKTGAAVLPGHLIRPGHSQW